MLQKFLHIAAGGFLSWAVNVLANSLKIFEQSKAVFFQLNLNEIHWNKG